MEQREKIVVANQASTTAAKSHGRKLLRGEEKQATAAHEENLSTVSKIQSSYAYSRRKQILFSACSSRYHIGSSSVKKSAVKFKV
jgi:hypothetical protein